MYEQPFLYGANDYSFEFPCGTDSLESLAQINCQTPPLFECSIEMLEIVKTVSGLNKHDNRERSPNNVSICLKLY